MRSFITLEFSEEVKNEIKKVQNTIRENSSRGRFKHIDNFHLTLKFLGETDNKKIEAINNELVGQIGKFAPFYLNLDGIGAFGIGETIRTIFIKLSGQVEELTRLAELVDTITFSQGFKRENKYVPHVTIAQDVLLNISYNQLAVLLNKSICEKLLFNKLTIMKSEQIGNKRVYTPIKVIEF